MPEFKILELGNATAQNIRTAVHQSEYDDAEEIIAELYLDLGYNVIGLDSAVESGSLQNDLAIPAELQSRLISELKDREDAHGFIDAFPLSFLEYVEGSPDFFVYDNDEYTESSFSFIEVKSPRTGLSASQIHWAVEIDHFPYKIAYVLGIT